MSYSTDIRRCSIIAGLLLALSSASLQAADQPMVRIGSIAIDRPAKIDKKTWDSLSDWQRDFFVKTVVDPKWRKTYGIAESSWTTLSPEARGQRVFSEIIMETRVRYEAGLKVLEGLLIRDSSAAGRLTIYEKKRFVEEVSGLGKRYPFIFQPDQPPPRQRDLEQAAARMQNELDYRNAGVLLKNEEKDLMRLRSLSDRLTGKEGDKEKLDKAFEKAGGKKGAATIPAPTFPGKGALPSSVQFHPLPDVRWTELVQSSFVKVDAMKPDAAELAFQKKFFEKIWKGMDVPVEKQLLEDVADAQRFLLSYRAAELAILDGKIKRIDDLLGRASTSTVRTGYLKSELKRTQEERALWESRDASIIVSAAPLQWAAGIAFWDAEPGPDKKRHLRVVFDSEFAHMPESEKPVEAMRKILVHETTHELDNLRMRPMRSRYTEPRAFLNESISYQQEGRPMSFMIEMNTGMHYEMLAKDPIGFLFRQFETYSQHDDYLWTVHAPDDFRNPREGFRWRLEMACRIFMKDFNGKPEDAEAYIVKKASAEAQGILTDEEVRNILIGVYRDPKINRVQKAKVFTERTIDTDAATLWIKGVGAVPDSLKKQYLQEEKDFWKRLAELDMGEVPGTRLKP